MGLTQTTTADLLKRAESSLEVEEILHAYTISKLANGGNAATTLRKLHLLTLYLRAVDLGHVMQEHYSAFAIVAFTVKLSAAGNTLDGGADATPGIPAGHTDAPALNMRAVLSPNVPNTALGIEAYNIARRPSRSIFRRLRSPSSASTTSSASSSSGGSSAFGMATGTSATIFGGSNQAGTSNEGSDVEDAVARRPDLGSRSSTTGSGTGRALPTRETLAEAQERLRRIAGAGTPSGLGTGLLSAPPRYDGGVAAYIESYAGGSTTPLYGGRTSFEELPDYIAA